MTAGSEFVGFLAPRLDYGRRLARLRWTRRIPGRRLVDLSPAARAGDAFAPGTSWIVVRDETALPVPGADVADAPGRVLLAAPLSPGASPVVHTLREVEESSEALGRTPEIGRASCRERVSIDV